jgi:hypothetical protein
VVVAVDLAGAATAVDGLPVAGPDACGGGCVDVPGVGAPGKQAPASRSVNPKVIARNNEGRIT